MLTAWGVCRGQKGLLAHNKEKSYTNTHTTRTDTKKRRRRRRKKNKLIKTHTQTQLYTHTHVQPSGPDQYMTRVNLLRTSGSPIKGLGVLIENHRSQGGDKQ